jgi:hypothetical protein
MAFGILALLSGEALRVDDQDVATDRDRLDRPDDCGPTAEELATLAGTRDVMSPMSEGNLHVTPDLLLVRRAHGRDSSDENLFHGAFFLW